MSKSLFSMIVEEKTANSIMEIVIDSISPYGGSGQRLHNRDS